MPPEYELVQEWLTIAAKDLRAADIILNVEPPLSENAGFHCQQAFEKSLKGFLTLHGIEFEKIHDLNILITQCAALNQDFEQWREGAQPIMAYAVRFRYPRSGPTPTQEQVQAALDVARRLHAFVLDRLPQETHPTRY